MRLRLYTHYYIPRNLMKIRPSRYLLFYGGFYMVFDSLILLNRELKRKPFAFASKIRTLTPVSIILESLSDSTLHTALVS